MKKKITLRQIANDLGISISTVSRALKGNKNIANDTRHKIESYAKKHNYTPNRIALSLKNRKTKSLGILIPEIVHHFFSSVVRGIELVANQRGYNVFVGLSNESFTKEILSMEMLVNSSIDGFILSISKETFFKQDYHHFNATIDMGIPIVMFDRVTYDINCDKVVVDDKNGSMNAVNLLIKKGCNHIGLITTMDYVSVGKLRTMGYIEALENNGITVNSNLILKIDGLTDLEEDLEDLEDLEEKIEYFFLNNKNIDGVLAVNELYAVTAMKVARKLKLNIPNDIQFIGFTDGVLSQHATPSLTTISQHGQKVGEYSANMLINRLEMLENENDYHVKENEAWYNYKTAIIETEIIERDSTK